MNNVKVSEARGELCIVTFGPVLRSDKFAKFRFFTWKVEDLGDGKITEPEVEVIRQGPIPKKGRLHVKVPFGTRCLVMAGGAEKAGVVTTQEHSLMAPFYVSLDAEPSTLPAQIAAKQAEANRPKRGILNGAISKIIGK